MKSELWGRKLVKADTSLVGHRKEYYDNDDGGTLASGNIEPKVDDDGTTYAEVHDVMIKPFTEGDVDADVRIQAKGQSVRR